MNGLSEYPEFTGKHCQNYVISPENAEVVNLAIRLGKPLVIEGEPGCGKTSLAYAVGKEFGIPVKVFPVKSTSQANDLLYRFDALRRLQDSQTNIENKQKKAEFAHNYVQLEFLGKAIHKGRKCVVLIDEVDKADIDFPDDLLHVLDKFEFPIIEIPEEESELAKAQEKYGAFVSGPEGSVKPIVIFTSNRSKSLSNPFLRRCFHLELNFPEAPEVLADIVSANLSKSDTESRSIETVENDLIVSAVESFLNIRSEAKLQGVTKVPATAELIDWLHVLHIRKLNSIEIKGLHPPYWNLLFKIAEDRRRYEQLKSTSIKPSA